MKQIEAIIYVEPTAKGRPRVTVIGGHAHAYTPRATRDAESMIKALIRKQVMEFGKFEDGLPLYLSATFYREKPASTPKKVTMPTKRPDLINYASLLFDALQKFVYADDSLIVTALLKKRFGSPPRIELLIIQD